MIGWLRRVWKTLRCDHLNVTRTHGDERLETGSQWRCRECGCWTNNPRVPAAVTGNT